MASVVHPSGVKTIHLRYEARHQRALHSARTATVCRHKDGQHEATLATFYRNYGDVRPYEDVIKLIER